MIVHCAARLGMLSYVYGHRFELAYSLGISSEKYIPLCKSDYASVTHLSLPAESGEEAPVTIQAADIQLFGPVDTMTLPERVGTVLPTLRHESSTFHSVPLPPIFHPPGLKG